MINITKERYTNSLLIFFSKPNIMIKIIYLHNNYKNKYVYQLLKFIKEIITT